MDSGPATLDFEIVQGDTFLRSLVIRDDDEVAIDLTSYELKAQTRVTPESSNPTNFEINIVDPTSGSLEMTISSEQTKQLQDGSWDMKLIYPSGRVRTILRGTIIVIKSVTDIEEI